MFFGSLSGCLCRHGFVFETGRKQVSCIHCRLVWKMNLTSARRRISCLKKKSISSSNFFIISYNPGFGEVSLSVVQLVYFSQEEVASWRRLLLDGFGCFERRWLQFASNKSKLDEGWGLGGGNNVYPALQLIITYWSSNPVEHSIVSICTEWHCSPCSAPGF